MAGRTVTVTLQAVVAGFQRDLQRAGVTAKGVRGELGQLTTVAQRNSAAFTAAGLAIGAAGAAITLGLRKAGQEAAEFESRLTKSVTLIGVSRDEMDRMGQAALRLSDTGQGPQDLADAMFFVQSAGLRGAEAMSVVEASAKASSIGLGETAVVADLVTSAVNAYGSENLNAASATDILIGTVREGKAEASELATSMGRVLPIASEMGVSFEEVGAATAAMTRTGTDAATSTTQLRAILVSLLKPTQQSEEALTELGLSSQMVRDTIKQDGLWAALELLRGSVGDNEAALGQLFPNVRALAGFLDLTGANAQETAAIFESMNDTTGLLADGFTEWSQTTEAAQMRFSASMEAARISLGESLQKPMKSVLDLGTGMAQTFLDLPGPMKDVVAVGGGVAGAGAAMAGGFLLAAPRISATKAALADLSQTMPKTVGLLRGTGSLLAGPFGLALVGAIAGVMRFSQVKAESRQRVEQFTAAIEADSGALDRNTRETMANLAEQEGLLEAAEQLGVAKGDVIGWLLGEEDATRRVVAATSGYNDELLGSLGAISGVTEGHENNADAIETLLSGHRRLTPEMQEGHAEHRRMAEALAEEEGRYYDLEHAISTGLSPAAAQIAIDMQEGTGHFGANAVAADDLGDEYGDLAEEISAADEALNDYVESLRKATDPVFRLESALSDVESAQSDYNDAVEEFGPNSDEAREASFRLMQRLGDLEQAAIDGDLSFEDFSDKLDHWVERGDITKEQADAIRERVEDLRKEAEDYQDDYEAHIKETGADNVRSKIDALKDALEALPSSTDIAVNAVAEGFDPTFGHTPRQHGGPVAAGQPYVVGEKRPEIFVPNMSGRIIPRVEGGLPGGGPVRLTDVNVKVASDISATDFNNAVGRASVNFVRAAGLSSGRVLPRGSYRIGRGSAAHGYGALDLPAPAMTPVYSVAAGIVSRAMRMATSYGIHAFVNHPGNRQSRYAHMLGLRVRQGQMVGAGQHIGWVGSTGNSTGNHLHYEDLLNGVRRRPERLGIFDKGGVLDPKSFAANMSMRPEMLLTETQWRSLATLAARGIQGDVQMPSELVVRDVNGELIGRMRVEADASADRAVGTLQRAQAAGRRYA